MTTVTTATTVAPTATPALDLVVAAYSSGHVPYGLADEIVWRIPAPRFYLDLGHARFPRHLRAQTARRGWTVTVGRAFDEVVAHCADSPRTDDVRWITPALRALYGALHDAGLACSVEVWDGDDLVAGELGVTVGGTFFCETKFHRASGAGNFCSGVTVLTLAAAGYSVYDTQYGPAYLSRFSDRGLEPVATEAFPALMARAATDRFRHFATGGPTGLEPVSPG